MNLGTGIFAGVFSSTILVLAVYHKQFRKVFFWVAGVSAVAAGIFFLSVRLYRKHEVKVRAEAEQKIHACVARFPVPYVLDGQRMSAYAIASACSRNPDFTPVANSNYLANIVEIRGGGTLQITPTQKFSPDGEPDAIPIIYLGHRQTFLLTCGNYGEPQTPISINQGMVSCPGASVSSAQDCPQWDEKADKWAKYLPLSLGDCTQNGCVVYHGKKIIGGISHNEITNAQWHACQVPAPSPGVNQVSSSK
ncbi:MAG TPA: hypothetical protein VJN89_00925 [Candidatus Acidoferrum sp.]|nr:hypothetical protein [Candidatus Acidoferrum sp.]